MPEFQPLVYLSEYTGHQSGSIHSYTQDACSLAVKPTNLSVTVELVPLSRHAIFLEVEPCDVSELPLACRPYFSFLSCNLFLDYNINTLYMQLYGYMQSKHLACAYDLQSIWIFSAIANSFEYRSLPLWYLVKFLSDDAQGLLIINCVVPTSNALMCKSFWCCRL